MLHHKPGDSPQRPGVSAGRHLHRMPASPEGRQGQVLLGQGRRAVQIRARLLEGWRRGPAGLLQGEREVEEGGRWVVLGSQVALDATGLFEFISG